MPAKSAKLTLSLVRANLKQARQHWSLSLDKGAIELLRSYTEQFNFSVASGDLLLLDRGWYVTHSGLLRLAKRKKCCGINVQAVDSLCAPAASRFVMKAIVLPLKGSSGFVGYGDADPSNVSPRVHGAEMRVAETRAVNRALRKAYGIGICSVEELGTHNASGEPSRETRKRPPQPTNGNGWSSGPRVRDRLCQLIRQHQLDPDLVKAYAIDFCGTKTLKEATRAQVKNFVAHLADWAEKDRNALVCQLNSYFRVKENPEQKSGGAA